MCIHVNTILPVPGLARPGPALVRPRQRRSLRFPRGVGIGVGVDRVCSSAPVLTSADAAVATAIAAAVDGACELVAVVVAVAGLFSTMLTWPPEPSIRKESLNEKLKTCDLMAVCLLLLNMQHNMIQKLIVCKNSHAGLSIGSL